MKIVSKFKINESTHDNFKKKRRKLDDNEDTNFEELLLFGTSTNVIASRL